MSPLNSYSGGPGVTGSVEICVDGVWTSLCGNEWSAIEAAVACRELGYMHYGALQPFLGVGDNDILEVQQQLSLSKVVVVTELSAWQLTTCK